MPDLRRTCRPLLTALVAGTLLVGGAATSTAAPASTAVPMNAAVAVSTAAPASTATSPAPSPGAEDDEADGLPWPGIIVGGGLGLVAGTVLMVLSKRRETRD